MSNLTSTPRETTLAKKTGYSKDKKTKNEDPQEATLKYVVDSFDKSWKYAETNYHTSWERCHSLYNNKRVKRGYNGVSDVFVPMTFSTIETMVAALAGGKPQFDYLPPQDKPDQNTEILNALLDYYWDKDQWHIKIQNLVRSMLVYGTGVGYLMWDIDHPILINIPVRDFFFDPNAVNIENAPMDFYCGRRYLTTKEELESFEVVDPETGETRKKYTNLDRITMGKGSNTGEETDKEKKDLFYGSTAPDPENTQVEVLELWTEEKVCSIANRSIVIQEEENPYLTEAKKKYGEDKAKGIIPFIVQRDYIDESLFLGTGEVDKIADLQELLNDNRNQRQDFISYTLNPMWNLNPSKADMIEEIEALPGRVFPLTPNDLTPVTMPTLPVAAFNNDQEIRNDLRETTASNEVVKGVNADTNATATEVNATIAQAGQRLSMKIVQLENEGFHRLARIVFEMVKLYTNQAQLVRIVGKDGIRWEEFDPAKFEGEYEPRVQLESMVTSKKNQDINMYKEMYLALAADPEVNQQELKKMVLPKVYDLDPDEVDRLLSQPDMPPMPEPMMGEAPPEPPMPEEELPQLSPEQLDALESELDVAEQALTGGIPFDPLTGAPQV